MNQSDELRRAIELLRKGKQLMDGVLAEYHEARQDERPFVIGCQEWREEAQALLLAADRQAAEAPAQKQMTVEEHWNMKEANHEYIFTELFKNYAGSEAKGFRHAMRRNLEPLLAAHDAALIAKTLAERQAAESPGPETPTEHTPLPWRVRQHPNDPDEFHISAATPKGHPYHGSTKEIEIMSDEDYPTKRADAELIVRAVNGLAERSLAEVSADEEKVKELLGFAWSLFNLPLWEARQKMQTYLEGTFSLSGREEK